jgi:hypothetical protein
MRALITFLVIVTLAGCATAPRYQPTAADKYAEKNYTLAESGQMKWSDYYIGLYDNVSKEPGPMGGEQLVVLSGLIDRSKDLENGKISQEEFDSVRRVAKGRFLQIESEHQMKMKQIEASRPAPEPYVYQAPIRKSRTLPPVQMPRTTNCSTWGNQTNCTTY